MARKFKPFLAASFGAFTSLAAEAKQFTGKFTAERVEEGAPIQVERECMAADTKGLRSEVSKAINKAIKESDVNSAFEHLDLQHRAAFVYLEKIARDKYGVELSIGEIAKLISQESGWRSEVRSDTTAVGLGQFVPLTFSVEMERYPEMYEEMLCETLPNVARMRSLYLNKYRSTYNNNRPGPDPEKDPEGYAEYQEMKAFFDLRKNDAISILAMGVHWLELKKRTKKPYTGYNQGDDGWADLVRYEGFFQNSNTTELHDHWEELSWHQQEHPRITKVRAFLAARGYVVPVGHLKINGKLLEMGEIHRALKAYDEAVEKDPESEATKLVEKTRLFSALNAQVLDAPYYAYPVQFKNYIQSIDSGIRDNGLKMTKAFDWDAAFGGFDLVTKIDRTGPIIRRMQAEMDAREAAEQAEEEARVQAFWNPKPQPDRLRNPARMSGFARWDDVILSRVRREDGFQINDAVTHYESPHPPVSHGSGSREFQEFLENTDDLTAILGWLEDDPLLGKTIARYGTYKDWSRTRCLRDVLHDLELVLSSERMDYLEEKIRLYHKTSAIGTVVMEPRRDAEEGVLEVAQIHSMDGEGPKTENLGGIFEDPVLSLEIAQKPWQEVVTILESSPYKTWVDDYKHYGGKLIKLEDFFANLKDAVEEGELEMKDLHRFKAFLENNKFNAVVQLQAKPGKAPEAKLSGLMMSLDGVPLSNEKSGSRTREVFSVEAKFAQPREIKVRGIVSSVNTIVEPPNMVVASFDEASLATPVVPEWEWEEKEELVEKKGPWVIERKSGDRSRFDSKFIPDVSDLLMEVNENGAAIAMVEEFEEAPKKAEKKQGFFSKIASGARKTAKKLFSGWRS